MIVAVSHGWGLVFVKNSNFFWWGEWIWQLSTGLSMFLENFGNGQWEMSWGVITMQYHVQEFERVLGNCANMALFHFLWHIDKDVFLLLLSSLLDLMVHITNHISNYILFMGYTTHLYKQDSTFLIILFAPDGVRSILQHKLFQKDGCNLLKWARKKLRLIYMNEKWWYQLLAQNFVHQRLDRQNCGPCFVWSSLIYFRPFILRIYWF